MNGLCYFEMTVPEFGSELWVTDGTTEGTHLVLDIRPGPDSSTPSSLMVFDNELYFAANDGTNGEELWKTDGSASGTIMVDDINAGSGSSSPTLFAVLGTELIFSANDGSTGVELFKSDGTSASQIKDINVGVGGSSPAQPEVYNSYLYFRATDGASGIEPWRTDGTTGNTTMVFDINTGAGSSSPVQYTISNGILFFRATKAGEGAELWKHDGVSTSRVADINAGAGSSNPSGLIDFNNVLYFSATDGASGIELWKSDGTTTTRVADLNVGAGGSSPTTLRVFDNRLFFSATDGTTGTELYESDGTTIALHDVEINAGGDATPAGLRVVDDFLIFSATDGAAGTELWKTDGTTISLVEDINIGAGSSSPATITVFGTVALFSATDGATGSELWTSDGTGGGTALVKDLGWSIGSSSPGAGVFLDDGSYYFSANDGTNGAELWKSDGTEAGTDIVLDIRPGSTGSTITGLTQLDATRFVFSANDGTNGLEPWKSDGTGGGTSMLSNIHATGNSSPALFVKLGSRVYFTATDGGTVFGKEVWRTDGTTTANWLDVRAGTANSNPLSLYVWQNSWLFFSANDGTNGQELWGTDGIATSGFIDINVGAGGSSPANFYDMNSSYLIFTATDGATGAEPRYWISSSPTTTTLIEDIIVGATSSNATGFVFDSNDARLYFSATDGTNGTELWRSRLTAANTNMATDINVTSVGASSSPSDFVFIAGTTNKTFFFANDGVTGKELYSRDASTTAQVIDLNPSGTGGNNGSELKVVGSSLYFSATDGATTYGQELWRSDGTSIGTAVVRDISAGVSSASPSNLTADADMLYFAATTPRGGTELWAVPIGVYSAFATDDSYSIDEDETILDLAPGVLVNDGVGTLEVIACDPRGDNGGTVSIQTDGALTYTPAEDFGGTETFVYAVKNTGTGVIDVVTVSVTVAPIADEPASATVDDLAVDEDDSVLLGFVGVTTTDFDGSEDYSITLSGLPTGTTLSAGTDLGSGSWSLAWDEILGTELIMAPDYDVDFTITVTTVATEQTGGDTESDAGQSVDVTVTAIPDDPVIDTPIADQNNIYEGETVTVTASATDVDTGDTLEYSIDPMTLEPGMTIDDVTGEFEWTIPLHAGFDGPMTVTVTIIVTDDFGGTVTDDFDIDIDAGTPVLNAIGAKSVYETATLTFTAGATDPNPGETFTYSLANAEAGMTIGSTSGAFSWTPAFGFGGTVQTVDVVVTDGGGLTDFETVSITLPVGTPSLDPIGDQTVSEAAELTFTVTADDPNPGDTLTFSIDFADATIDPDTGEFSWTPAQGAIGDQDITFTVTDSQGLTDDETITVTVEVGAPVITSIPDKQVKEGITLSFQVDADDPNGDTITYSLDAAALALGATIGASSGVFSWVPPDTIGGTTVNITVSVSDGTITSTDTFSVIVVDTNAVPYFASTPIILTVSAGTSYSYTIIANDDDVPAQTLTITSLAQLPSWITLTSAGDGISFLTGTPQLGDVGSYDISLRVTDGVDSSAQTFTVTVTGPGGSSGNGSSSQQAAPSGIVICSLSTNAGMSGALIALISIALIGGSLRRVRPLNKM